MDKQLVFIAGSKGSGSSLLANLLLSGEGMDAGGRHGWHGENLDLCRICEGYRKAVKLRDEERKAKRIEELEAQAREFYTYLFEHPWIVLKTPHLCYALGFMWRLAPAEFTKHLLVPMRTPANTRQRMQKDGNGDAYNLLGDMYGAVFTEMAKLVDARPLFVQYERMMQSPNLVIGEVVDHLKYDREDTIDVSIVNDGLWRHRPGTGE